MMLHASTQQLIRKLYELTETSAISWKEGEGQRVVFETEGYIVELQPDPPGIRLLRADGQELETADAADLALAWPEGGGTYASHVTDMVRRASRIARGAETAIAKILSSLSAPPKKQPEAEPEPEPAALALASAPAKPAPSVSAGESAAAIAAVTADLESQRRKATEEPPVSHTVPQAPIAASAPETETAIDRILAVQQPAPRAEPIEPAPAPEPPPVAKAAPEPPPAPKPSPSAPAMSPRAIDLPPPFADATMQPQLKRETIAPMGAPVAAPIAASAPQPPPVAIAPAPAPATKPEPIAAPAPQPSPVAASAPQPPPAAAAPPPASKPGFGSIGGFSRAEPTPAPQPKAEPKPEPSKITSGGLLMTGISARSRQTVESSTAQGALRPATPPAPAPQPAPVPPPEKKLEPAAATGADVYKPWA